MKKTFELRRRKLFGGVLSIGFGFKDYGIGLALCGSFVNERYGLHFTSEKIVGIKLTISTEPLPDYTKAELNRLEYATVNNQPLYVYNDMRTMLIKEKLVLPAYDESDDKWADQTIWFKIQRINNCQP